MKPLQKRHKTSLERNNSYTYTYMYSICSFRLIFLFSEHRGYDDSYHTPRIRIW